MKQNNKNAYSNIDKSLREAWACFTQWYLGNLYYKLTFGGSPNQTIPNRQDWKVDVNDKLNPILIDLMDNYNQAVSNKPEGYSPYPMDLVKNVPAFEIEWIAMDSKDKDGVKKRCNMLVGLYCSQTQMDLLLQSVLANWYR